MKTPTWPILLSLLTICVALSSCRGHVPARPVHELCIVGKAGCHCHDPRRPEPQYFIPHGERGCYKNIAVTPESYKQDEDWIRQLLDLIDQAESKLHQMGVL